MSYPKFCVKRRLNEEQQADSVTLAMKVDPDNLLVGNDNVSKLMAVSVGKKWSNHKVLRVAFLNGDSVQRFKCQREAKKWEEFANITFLFVTESDAEIRVAFYDGTDRFNDQGSWSYIGTDCGLAKPDEQTLNLGWLDKNSSDEEWERVVVHEFGHVLGCDHEDQQPAENIQWNREAVYKYFEGPPNNWSKADIDTNILDPESSEGVSHTEFDSTSIMAYQIPAEFTLDGKGVSGGTKLSDRDKKFIGQMYPFRETAVKLVLDGPQVRQEITPTKNRTTLALTIPDSGVYRIWTSLIDGDVSITGPDGVTVGVSKQQIVFKVDPGEYTIVIRPYDPTITTSYRIRAAKIG